MTEHDTLEATLEAAVPAFDDEHGDWDDVLARASRSKRPRRRRQLAVPALAGAAVACALLLAEPFADDDVGVLDRALAAVGDGPVLHLVTQSGGRRHPDRSRDGEPHSAPGRAR